MPHPHERYFSDVTDNIILYYAALDDFAQPFKPINGSPFIDADEHIDHLKCLSLIVDHIVIPPTFLFRWTSSCKMIKSVFDLMDLYQAGIISSSVYAGLSCTDFVEYKLLNGTPDERRTISSSKTRITNLFKAIPNRQRNVSAQSVHFLKRLYNEYHKISASNIVLENIKHYVEHTTYTGAVVARRPINGIVRNLYETGQISKCDYLKAFYACNRAYYLQGSSTYNSPISILNANQHTNLGQSIFSSRFGINIAYDPSFVSRIFIGLGISPDHIRSFSIMDILQFRESSAFAAFKQDYLKLSENARSILTMNTDLTERIVRFKDRISSHYSVDNHKKQRKQYLQIIKYLGSADVLLSNVLLTALGYFVSGMTGTALGFLAGTGYGYIQQHHSGKLIYPRIADLIYGNKHSNVMFSETIANMVNDK